MTTVKISNPSMRETLMVRCDLTRAASPVEVNYMAEADSGWQPTQYQTADCLHRPDRLGEIGARLLAAACEVEYVAGDYEADGVA